MRGSNMHNIPSAVLHALSFACRSACVSGTLRWFEKWAEYANFKRDTNGEPDTVRSPLKIQHIAPRPGAIDNTQLLDAPSCELREGLREGSDFTVINKETWELLRRWYGRQASCSCMHGDLAKACDDMPHAHTPNKQA